MIPWRRERLPITVFWPGEFHGLYSPWGRKESDMTFTSLTHSKNIELLLEMRNISPDEGSWTYLCRQGWQVFQLTAQTGAPGQDRHLEGCLSNISENHQRGRQAWESLEVWNCTHTFRFNYGCLFNCLVCCLVVEALSRIWLLRSHGL